MENIELYNLNQLVKLTVCAKKESVRYKFQFQEWKQTGFWSKKVIQTKKEGFVDKNDLWDGTETIEQINSKSDFVYVEEDKKLFRNPFIDLEFSNNVYKRITKNTDEEILEVFENLQKKLKDLNIPTIIYNPNNLENKNK